MPTLPNTNFWPVNSETYSSTLSSSIGAGVTTVPVASASPYTDGDIVVLTVEPGVSGQQATFTGTKSGNSFINCTWTEGNVGVGHAGGAAIKDYDSATHYGLVTKGLRVFANQDGTLKTNVITTSNQITDGIVGDAEMATEVKPVTRTLETTFDYIASGCVLSGTGYGSTLNWSLTAGVVYINGRRLTVPSASGTVTASRDTYFDLLDPGSGTTATLVNTGGNIVTNNAASPSLAANSVRLGIIVSGASAIANAAAVNQGQEDRVLPIASSIPYAVTDSLGNLICPRDPNRKLLGYRQIVSSASTTSGTDAQITGLTCPVIVPATRKVKVAVYSRLLNNATSNVFQQMTLWEGAVGSGTQLSEYQTDSGGQSFAGSGVHIEQPRTPTTSSVTYNAGFKTSAGTATVNATTLYPAYIKVELL